MKIIDNQSAKRVKLHTIKLGKLFRYNKKIYIVTNESKDTSRLIVALNTGVVQYLDPNTLVRSVTVELVVCAS